MFNDFFFTINQAAIILNRSDKSVRVYITEGALHSEKRYEEGSGIEKVYVSASSLSDLARVRGIIPNYEALTRYAPEAQRDEVLAAFQQGRTSTPLTPSNPLPTHVREEGEQREIGSTVETLLREQIARLESQNEELGEKLERKDARIEELHRELLDTTKKSGDDYRVLALAKEQLEIRFAKVREHVRTISLATNRDILRLRAGKLSPQDLSPLPIPSEVNPGEFEAPAEDEEIATEQHDSTGPKPSTPVKIASSLAEAIVTTAAGPERVKGESIKPKSRRHRRTPTVPHPIQPSAAKSKRLAPDKATLKSRREKKAGPQKIVRPKPKALIVATPTPPAKKRGLFSRLFGRAP